MIVVVVFVTIVSKTCIQSSQGTHGRYIRHFDNRYDNLLISVGPAQRKLGRFCGHTLLEGDIIKSNSSKVTLEFVSDSNINNLGFKFEYFSDDARNLAKGSDLIRSRSCL